MNKYIKSKLVLFFGIFFIASLSADPLLHDHIDEHQSESIIECQLCENKAFDLQNADSEVSELIHISFVGNILPDIQVSLSFTLIHDLKLLSERT